MGGGFGGVSRGLMGDIKQLMDKQTLTVAGGAVASGLLSGYVLSKFGGAQAAGAFSLPGSQNKYGVIAYQLLIPVGGAFLVKRFSPNLAKGFLLGGVIAAMQSILAIAMPTPGATATTGTSAYLDNMRPVGANPPGYSAIDAFGASIYSSEPAFHSAWGN